MSRAYPEVITATVAKREKELEELRGRYQEAKAKAAGRDGKALIEIARLLKAYQMGDNPEKAVYIVAQVTMLINTLVAPFVIIEDYEARVKTLDELKKG